MIPRVFARLTRANATAVFLATTVLVLGALIIGGWIGALVLLGLGAGMLTILVRLWPALDPRGRASRIMMLVILVALAVAQIAR
ncbi:MAG: hypothetical protein HKP61_04370 [Dactylosporangium sp.]|nr:hypothetical protein [Dactylosporangium sp.]NNJ60188.1 hypothetical protein [Dactylosporangium sp.]